MRFVPVAQPSAILLHVRVVQLDPDNEEARLRLTGLLVQNQKGAEALPHLEVLRTRTPDDPRIAVRIAQCRGRYSAFPYL